MFAFSSSPQMRNLLHHVHAPEVSFPSFFPLFFTLSAAPPPRPLDLRTCRPEMGEYCWSRPREDWRPPAPRPAPVRCSDLRNPDQIRLCLSGQRTPDSDGWRVETGRGTPPRAADDRFIPESRRPSYTRLCNRWSRNQVCLEWGAGPNVQGWAQGQAFTDTRRQDPWRGDPSQVGIVYKESFCGGV